MPRVILGALAIFVAYNVLLAYLRPQATPSSDIGMRNRIIAERYFDGSVPPAVIVGTSVAFRLSPDFLQGDYLQPTIYNLALGGGSAASGFDIMVRKGELPRIVFVETNFAFRGADPVLLRELVAEPRLTLRRYLPALRLENRPVDLLITSFWASVRSLIAGRPTAAEPEIANFAGRLAVTLSQNAGVSAVQRTETEAGIEMIGAQVDMLRARNVRIILLQFPMHAAVEDSPLRQYVRSKVDERFPPERYEWLAVPDVTSFRTDDGLHLTRPSGRRLAVVLRDFAEQARRR